jgi:predicted Ser/Thr protein kinase
MLQYESRIFKKLRGNEGIPRVYWYGVDGEFRVMAMSIHGPNLASLLKFTGG